MLKVDTLLKDRAAFQEVYGTVNLIDGSGHVLKRVAGATYKLANRRYRLLAEVSYHQFSRTTLLDANGEGIGAAYKTGIPEGSRTEIWRPNGEGSLLGVISITGDTILPLIYTKVSVGTRVLVGIKNDTAYIFDRDGKLLSHFEKVHGCEVLSNNLLVLEKHGAMALAHSSGKLLSEFRYYRIKDFHYSIATLPVKNDVYGRAIVPDIFPGYVQVDDDYLGHGGGLLDTTGKIVLQNKYKRFDMNSNGWFVLEKFNSPTELLDNNFKLIFSAPRNAIGYSDIRFIDERYVMVPPSAYYPQKAPMVYDMVTRTFVRAPEQKPYVRNPPRLPNKDYALAEKKYKEVGYMKNDTTSVNTAGTMVLKRNKKWGAVSITGDTVLPFIYDTAIGYGQRNHPVFVGINGKFAYLDWQGKLATPLVFTVGCHIIAKDSVAVMNDQTVYSYKLGKLRKIDREKEPPIAALFNGSSKGLFCALESGANKPGIYNRQLKLLTTRQYPSSSCYDILDGGLVIISDSLKQNIALIDSTGRFVLPWMSINTHRYLYPGYALILNNTGSIGNIKGKADILCRFEKNQTLFEVITVDTSFITSNEAGRWLKYDKQRPWSFEKKGEGKGIGGFGKIFFIKDADEIKFLPEVPKVTSQNNRDYRDYERLMQVHGAVVNIKNKWGLYKINGEMVVPADYDSIIHAKTNDARRPNRNDFFLYQNGREGLYDYSYKKIIPTVFDSLYSLNSISRHFYVGRTANNKIEFVNESGKIISKNWDSSPNRFSNQICGFQVTQNSRLFNLYPTLADTLESLTLVPFTGNVNIIVTFRDGAVIVKIDSMYGVYDVIEKKWRIPLRYKRIKEADEHFAAYTTSVSCIDLYNWDGQLLFSKLGNFRDAQRIMVNQWILNGRYNGPVVNKSGKVIVPDTCYAVEIVWFPGHSIYKAVTKNNLPILIDTSGKILDPNFIKRMTYESLENGYYTVTRDKKKSLVDRGGDGARLSPFIYHTITECKLGRSQYDAGKKLYISEVRDEHYEFRPQFIVSKKVADKLKYGILDEYGYIKIPCMYDSICPVLDGKHVFVKKGQFWGVVSADNQPVYPFKYVALNIYWRSENSYPD